MMEFFDNFHFLRPWYLLFLLIPLFLLFRKKGLTAGGDSPWAQICDKPLLDFLLVKKSADAKQALQVLRFIILLILPLALAGPSWQKIENPALKVDNPLIIALNMSSDMWGKDVSPSRAVRAKFLIKDILRDINTTETGLEVYSREPFMISPISEDKNLVDNLLPALTYDIMPENGDRLDRAVDLAVERLHNTGYDEGNIIVLTSDVGERFDLALQSAAKAAAEGYKVNIIDINAKKNSKLQMVAEKGHGVYLSYNENLKPLISDINDITDREFNQSRNLQTVWFDNGYYLLFLPALLLLYFFRRGVIALFFITLLCAQNADAGWFLNNNQEAMKAFEKGDYNTATEKFDNQPWKAGSAYKKGDYAKASQIYSTLDGDENLYNLGNALAKSGKIEEAIVKYEEVLKQNPNHEDAKFNLEYLKQQQQNQQNQQQNQQQNKQNQDNSQQQQQQNSQATQKNQENQSQENQENRQSESQSQQNENDGQDNQQSSQDKQNEQEQSAAQSQSQQKEQADSSDGNKANASEQSAENQDKEEKSPVPSEGSNNEQDNKQQQMRAKQQKFREIPEDKGGLLRAFIKKEYNRKRYQE